MPTRFDAHIPEDSLELYSMGRLPENEIELFEEHLLACHSCQDRLAETDSFVRVMREATRRVEASPASAKANWNPRMAWGLALAGALALVVAVPQLRQKAVSEQEVALTAMRGARSAAPHASSNRQITLRIDATELPAASAYGIELVDAVGRAVWQGRGEVRDGNIVQPTGRSLDAGQYWVRLYRETPDRPLVREFSLLVAD